MEITEQGKSRRRRLRWEARCTTNKKVLRPLEQPQKSPPSPVVALPHSSTEQSQTSWSSRSHLHRGFGGCLVQLPPRGALEGRPQEAMQAVAHRQAHLPPPRDTSIRPQIRNQRRRPAPKERTHESEKGGPGYQQGHGRVRGRRRRDSKRRLCRQS